MRTRLRLAAISFCLVYPGSLLAQDNPLSALSEDEIQMVEKQLHMNRQDILETSKRFPFPKQFAPADKIASEALAKQLAAVLQDQLPDFRSSRIRKVKAVLMQQWNSFSRSYYICGEINTKNRFGAYIGWHSFYADRKEGKVEVYLDNGPVGALMIPQICVASEGRRALDDTNPSYLEALKQH